MINILLGESVHFRPQQGEGRRSQPSRHRRSSSHWPFSPIGELPPPSVAVAAGRVTVGLTERRDGATQLQLPKERERERAEEEEDGAVSLSVRACVHPPHCKVPPTDRRVIAAKLG